MDFLNHVCGPQIKLSYLKVPTQVCVGAIVHSPETEGHALCAEGFCTLLAFLAEQQPSLPIMVSRTNNWLIMTGVI